MLENHAGKPCWKTMLENHAGKPCWRQIKDPDY
jgi:hypothetical protein